MRRMNWALVWLTVSFETLRFADDQSWATLSAAVWYKAVGNYEDILNQHLLLWMLPKETDGRL